ncbi:MAG TPA: hypothetical protein VG538_07495 [Vicinamibacterales bacterium]|jgi:hypothetical protein|nr:hypothetical protein [Vicinamibacterales bacterium]
MPRSSVFWSVWRWPLAIAALTIVGLLAALLGGHGVWWWLSWTTLLTPIAVALRYWPLRVFFRGD